MVQQKKIKLMFLCPRLLGVTCIYIDFSQVNWVTDLEKIEIEEIPVNPISSEQTHNGNRT